MASVSNQYIEQEDWLRDLARAEIHPDAEEILNLGKASDPQQLVSDATTKFLNELRDHFNRSIKIFNSYSEQGQKFLETKIYNIAHSDADFMIYRNQVKLIVSNAAHGVIRFSFLNHLGNTFSVEGQKESVVGTKEHQTVPEHNQEIVAQIGPFRNVFWTFQGEKVGADQVAKFYFIEFIKLTRKTKKSKTGNQLLLEEIKTLLQEKGFDI